MLTKLKQLKQLIFNLKEISFLTRIYLQHKYLIKFRKMRHFQIDWKLTQKFFSKTFISYFIFKAYTHQFFKYKFFSTYFLFYFKSNILNYYYLLWKWGRLQEQFIDISNLYYEQTSIWTILDCLFLLEFPYIYDKIDRKKRWTKLFSALAKKYIISFKYYNGKITSFKETE